MKNGVHLFSDELKIFHFQYKFTIAGKSLVPFTKFEF